MEETRSNSGDRNKIYFLIIVIVALLGTNAFLFFKDKKQSEKFVTVNTEKDQLKLELEKVEVELEKVGKNQALLGEDLLDEQNLAQLKLDELKIELQKGQLTQGELDKAHKDIKELKEFVRNYSKQVDQAIKENGGLKTNQDSLNHQLADLRARNSRLKNQNNNLNNKVKKAAVLSASHVDLFAYRLRSNNKKSETNRSSSAEYLSIKFNILPNDLVEAGHHKVYLRVFDPAGNLIADEDNHFEADGQDMQFSYTVFIDYSKEESEYTLDWKNPKPFIKGIYTAILYNGQTVMGRGQIELH